MKRLPKIVLTAWSNREGFPVLTTVNSEGQPNSIYVGSIRIHGDDTLVIADNFFHKTRANILAGSKGVLLFITKDHKAYQIKGRFTYHRDGPVFEDMKTWNSTEYPGIAAAALTVEEVYCGAEQLL